MEKKCYFCDRDLAGRKIYIYEGKDICMTCHTKLRKRPLEITYFEGLLKNNSRLSKAASESIEAEIKKDNPQWINKEKYKNPTTEELGEILDSIKKYKELFEMGAITQEEFEEKKGQLLGIKPLKNVYAEENEVSSDATEKLDAGQVKRESHTGFVIFLIVIGIFLLAWFINERNTSYTVSKLRAVSEESVVSDILPSEKKILSQNEQETTGNAVAQR